MVQVGDRTQFGRVCIISPNYAGQTNVWVECHDGTLPLFTFNEHPTLREVQQALGDPELIEPVPGEVSVKHVRALPEDGGIPLPTGGRTLAATASEDGVVTVAVALCQVTDVFDADYGARLAASRLDKPTDYTTQVPIGTMADVYVAGIEALTQGPVGELILANIAEVGE